MPENPLIHHQYVEAASAEDLISPDPLKRANKIVVTSSEGYIPDELIEKETDVISGIKVNGSEQTLHGVVDLVTKELDALHIEFNETTNEIEFSSTSVSSINDLNAGVRIIRHNNIMIETDLVQGHIAISDDLISEPKDDSDIEIISEVYSIYDDKDRIKTITRTETLKSGQVNTRKTVTLTYDQLDRLTKEEISFYGSSKKIVKTYSYREDRSSTGDFEDFVPLGYSKKIV